MGWARGRARDCCGRAYSGLTSDDFERLEALMRWRMGGGAAASAERGPSEPDRLRQAYALLETPADATDEQVVKAYRRQMSRNHPDKLQAKGLPESMLERAKERTQQIQAAYELVRTARGMR